MIERVLIKDISPKYILKKKWLIEYKMNAIKINKFINKTMKN